MQQEHATRRLARAIERLALIEAAKARSDYGPENFRRMLEETEQDVGPLLQKLVNRREATDGKRQKGG